MDTALFGANQKAFEKRRRASQVIFDSIPAQIDAIKEKRERDAIELRLFVMKRERAESIRQSCNGEVYIWESPVAPTSGAPRKTVSNRHLRLPEQEASANDMNRIFQPDSAICK